MMMMMMNNFVTILSISFKISDEDLRFYFSRKVLNSQNNCIVPNRETKFN